MSFQLYVTGHTIPDIATRLLISQRSVERDISFMRKHAKQAMRQYFTHTLPESVLTNIARLNLISNEAFKSAELAKERKQGKLMIDSLRLAKEVAATLVEITTNNKGLIDSAYDIVDSAENELSKIDNQLSSFTTADNSPIYNNSSSSSSSSSSSMTTEAHALGNALSDNDNDNDNDSSSSSSSSSSRDSSSIRDSSV